MNKYQINLFIQKVINGCTKLIHIENTYRLINNFEKLYPREKDLVNTLRNNNSKKYYDIKNFNYGT